MIKDLLRTSDESRSPELLREHYEIEKMLAAQLRTATREQRRSLYTHLYNELFRRVPHHPQLSRKTDALASAKEVARKMKLVRPHLDADKAYLEVGPGDCAFAFEAAKYVRSVVAIDVSEEIVRRHSTPRNFRLVLSDGCTVPVPDSSIDVVYSNQLMEHLHTDDAEAQLRNIYAAMAPRGRYICITPNRYSGPHDVSQYFDDEATGFHLHEYSYAELHALFRWVGFGKIVGYIGGRGLYVRFPMQLLLLLEKLLDLLPKRARRKLARSAPGRALLGINLAAFKPA